MGMPVIGTVANIEGFTRQDLVRHVQAHYVGEKTVVVAAGNFDVPAWLERAAQLFAGMRASADPAVALPPRPAGYVGQALARRFTQVSQVFVNLAYPLVFEQLQGEHPQRARLVASLAAHLLGEGMSSPLVDTVRERLGLAYTAYAAMEGGDVWASFVVHAVTTPDKLEALVAATGSLLRAQAAGIDPVHLERAKNQLAVSRVRAGERTYASMERAVEELFAHGSVTSVAETLAMIDGIGAEEVRRVFERMLAHPPAVAITGKGANARTVRQLAAGLAA
jgi:predicted Zn-dependent peptidase